MSLTRTRAAVQACETQIAALNLDPFMQNCLAQYLAVVFYAEMEERVADVISHELQKHAGTLIGKFLTSNMDKIIRRTPKSDIVNLLGNFGDEFKTAFNGLVSDRDVSLYSNVIAARHNVGHRNGSNITMQEISRGVTAAEDIVAALELCFQIGP
ncbi:hypothetical protein SAMN03159423_5250 [Bradyrhizobium sp. NFR13]|uniref:HEPN domain-containing protein n=1 Tax=Bradyrhizobium sp. NFR13 TaxID=1566285 RepID=UPI0008F12734|nr:HEPN domain-containing protein [Bradyrhizobium sp. NFR13]SFM08584.1 hypothetical protein SAMN03159423_5250 [Bradyrhizobium sp. NFR13]